MTALLLPFAKRIFDGEYVSPDEVERGRACNCVCPGCNLEVVARQGPERIWHFAHSKSKKCSTGYEVSIHELAKQLLRQHKEFLLPSLVASVLGRDAFGFQLEVQEPVLQSKLVKLDDCKTGVDVGGVNVDAIGTLNSHEVLIEISVFHRLMPDKEERIIATGIPSFQINLNQFTAKQATKELLEKALFANESNRRWIFHPRLNQAIVKAQAKLDVQLQESKDRWKKQEELRTKVASTNKFSNTNADRQFGLSNTWESSAEKRSNLRFRAFLPTTEKVAESVTKFAERTGLSEEKILSITSTITNRGQLRVYTPEDFANKWSEQLNLPFNEVEGFLVDAGYLVRYF